MESSKSSLLNNKLVLVVIVFVAIVLYALYLAVLVVLAIPYLPEMIVIETPGEVTVSPSIFLLGAVAFFPVLLGLLILNFRSVLAELQVAIVVPLKELNYKILTYVTILLLLQLILNGLMVVVLVLIKPDFWLIASLELESAILIWIISCGFSLIATVVNILIGFTWIKLNLDKPRFLHWLIGHLIFFSIISVLLIVIQTLNPTVKGLASWPVSGMVMLGAFSYFVMFFGLFIGLLGLLIYPLNTGQGDAYVGFVFMMGILFMLGSVLFFVIPVISFYIGIFLGKRLRKRH